MKVRWCVQDAPDAFKLVGPINTVYYMTDGNILHREVNRVDGIDAYWVNGHRVFKAVWDRYYGEAA